MGSVTQGVQARRRKETRDRIVTAAERVFADYGFDGASFSRIAEQAGLPTSNIFYYSGTKRKLYRLLVEHNFKIWREAADAITPKTIPRRTSHLS